MWGLVHCGQTSSRGRARAGGALRNQGQGGLQTTLLPLLRLLKPSRIASMDHCSAQLVVQAYCVQSWLLAMPPQLPLTTSLTLQTP